MKAEEVRRATVLGGGTMGHGIAQLLALAGMEVVIRDIEQRFLDDAVENIEWSLGKLVEKGRIGEHEKEATLQRVSTELDLVDAVEDADFVIEAIPEKMSLKKETFAQVSDSTREEVVMATNTSSLPITEIADATDRPEKVVGMHFFNPPQIMPLVEVVRGEMTSEETLDFAVELSGRMGKQTVVCRKDVPGFIVNRILGALLNEAGWMVERGEAEVLEIDSEVKYKLGLPMGLFEVADYSGLDIFHDVLTYLVDEGVVDEVSDVWEEKVEEGNLGKKTGRGFYSWKDGERPEIPPMKNGKVDLVQILAPAVNEAAELLEEDVATKEDIDKAVRLGLGFPKGILEMGDEYGLDVMVEELEELHEKYGLKSYEATELLKRHVREGRKGKKTNQGFYQYEEKEEFETIRVESDPEKKVSWLYLSRPERLNAITKEMLGEVEDALDQLAEDDETRVLLISGDGDRAFSSGADVTAFGAISATQAAELARRGQRCFNRVQSFPKPVIAVIDGYALGGGSELSLACDFRIASKDSEIGQPEVDLGILPGWGGTQRLPRTVGLQKAKELIFTGKRVSAQEALEIGLVDDVALGDELDRRALEFAETLASGPPIAISLAKACLNQSAQVPLEAGLEMEAEAFGNVFSTEDFAEGVSAFLSNREPEFEGK